MTYYDDFVRNPESVLDDVARHRNITRAQLAERIDSIAIEAKSGNHITLGQAEVYFATEEPDTEIKAHVDRCGYCQAMLDGLHPKRMRERGEALKDDVEYALETGFLPKRMRERGEALKERLQPGASGAAASELSHGVVARFAHRDATTKPTFSDAVSLAVRSYPIRGYAGLAMIGVFGLVIFLAFSGFYKSRTELARLKFEFSLLTTENSALHEALEKQKELDAKRVSYWTASRPYLIKPQVLESMPESMLAINVDGLRSRRAGCDPLARGSSLASFGITPGNLSTQRPIPMDSEVLGPSPQAHDPLTNYSTDALRCQIGWDFAQRIENSLFISSFDLGWLDADPISQALGIR